MALPSEDTFAHPEHLGEKSVWAERTGTRELIGGNQRGVEIPIGHGEGRISPGELLKLALIGCAGMSMDLSVGRRIGEDFQARLWAHGDSGEGNRYHQLREDIQIAADGLTPERLADIRDVIDKAIAAGCTVQRTVTPGVPVDHTLRTADGTAIDENVGAEEDRA